MTTLLIAAVCIVLAELLALGARGRWSAYLAAALLAAGLILAAATPAPSAGTGQSSCKPASAGKSFPPHYLFGCAGDWDYCNQAWRDCYAQRKR